MWTTKYAKGERCTMCGAPAVAKVGEEIMDDDPFPDRHNLTAYVCEQHFRAIFGNFGVDLVESVRQTPDKNDLVLPLDKGD